MPTFKYRLRSNRRCLCIDDYRRVAQRSLPALAWAYLDGGADCSTTLAANRAAFGRWNLEQRVLAGISSRDLGVTVAGVDLSLPVILAPTGLTGLMHWQGELGAAKAAEQSGTRLVLSTAATYSLEEVAVGTDEDHWFQLYPWRDRAFIEHLVDRASETGYGALFVTVDVPVLGNRIEEKRNGVGIPPTLTPRTALNIARHPRWAFGLVRHGRVTMRNLVEERGAGGSIRSLKVHSELIRPDLDWDDFAWIRSLWKKPLFIKGVLNIDDAVTAVALGADGVVVSNHGGRQLDGAASGLDMLPALAQAVGGQAQILVDGGISHGSDVIKALCLGADACLIGRAFIYGLAAEGGLGVLRVLTLLRTEIDRTLTLMGCADVKALDETWIMQKPQSA